MIQTCYFFTTGGGGYVFVQYCRWLGYTPLSMPYVIQRSCFLGLIGREKQNAGDLRSIVQSCQSLENFYSDIILNE